MGKQYKIGYIKMEKKELKGKDTDCVNVKLINGAHQKWETIYSFNKCYSAAAVCNKDDTVEVTYEKKTVNGKDYFNVVGFTRIDTTNEETPTAVKESVIPNKPFDRSKSDDTQLSICRQSSNTAAMNFVIGMLTNGLYPKKSTPDMLFEEIKRFAKKFEEYVTLKGDYGAVDTAISSISSEVQDDEEVQF